MKSSPVRDRAENRNHFLGEPSSVKSLCIQGKYVILPPPVKCGKEGLKCAKLFEKKILQANISGACFRLLSDKKGDKSWFSLLSYCLLVSCKILLSCCLFWIQAEHLNLPSVLCDGSNPSSYSSVIVALLIRSLVKSFT